MREGAWGCCKGGSLTLVLTGGFGNEGGRNGGLGTAFVALRGAELTFCGIVLAVACAVGFFVLIGLRHMQIMLCIQHIA